MIEGDPEAIEAAARELRRVAAAFDEKSADVIRHANEVTAEWTGTAADAARDRITFLGRRLLIARDVNEDAATAWEHYAAELRIAQREYAEGRAQCDTAEAQQLQLRERAAAAPAPDPAQDALLAAAGRQVTSGQHAMDAAVEREQVANGIAARALDALTDELSTMTATSPATSDPPVMRPAGPKPEESWWSDNKPGWNDWADFSNGVLMVPYNSVQLSQRLEARANLRHADAVERNRQLKGTRGPGVAGEKRYVRALRDSSAAQAVDHRQARLRAGSWRHPVLEGPLKAVNLPIGRVLPPAAAIPVVRHVPVLNVALTGVGVAMDVDDGMSASHAVVKNVASTGAGMAVGAATTSVLAGVSIVGAPVLAGVAAGALLGYGVGLAVEHWGDDVARGVSSAAESVADAAEDVWDAVTPW